MPLLLNKTLRLFLDSIGRREEYEYYLKRFQNLDTASFAILAPQGPGFEDVARVFAFDMDFLLRVELAPVIVLAGRGSARIHATLCTPPHCYAPFRLQTLPGGGTRPAEPLFSFLEACRRRHQIGLLLAPRHSLRSILLRLVPAVARRVHFIRVRGPLHAAAGTPLSYFYTERPPAQGLAAPDRPLARLGETLLRHAPGVHLSVASPWKLLDELFTVKGAGCVIRRGSPVRHMLRDALDAERTRTLLECGFARRLRNLACMEAADAVYLAGDYRGIALLERFPQGMYLSKFSVDIAARGEGVAQELWDVVAGNHPALFWRSRRRNPVNHWYERRADGLHRAGRWTVFWRGVRSEDVSGIIRLVLEKADDFSADTPHAAD